MASYVRLGDCAPLKTFPCCAKTVYSRLNSNLGCCHGNNFVKEHFGKNFSKNGIFLLLNVLRSDFLARKRNQRLRVDPCATFQLNWTEDKGTRILTWNNNKKKPGLMILYLPHSDDLDHHNAKFGCNLTKNKGETEGAYLVPKIPAWIGLTLFHLGRGGGTHPHEKLP